MNDHTSVGQKTLDARVVDDILKKLDTVLSYAKTSIPIDDKYESSKTEEINSSMAQASLEYPEIKINRQNPYLAAGYSDLHEIMKKIRPVLGKHNLHLTQIKKQIDGRTILITRIWHSSGQWIESRVFITPSKNTIDSYGSYRNSMKRFEVMDILGLTVSGDPYDDDGEADMEDEREVVEMGSKLKTLYSAKKESYETITAAQYEELMFELDDHQDLVAEMLDKLNVSTLREIPKSRFKPTIDRVRRIVKKRA